MNADEHYAVRSAVRAEVANITPPDTINLANDLHRRRRRRQRTRVASLCLSLVAIGVAAALAGSTFTGAGDEEHRVATEGDSQDGNQVADVLATPGWHYIDPGPREPAEDIALVGDQTRAVMRTGHRLFLSEAGREPWRELPHMPEGMGTAAGLAVTETSLVAVSASAEAEPRSAYLDLEDPSEWTVLEGPARAPELQRADDAHGETKALGPLSRHGTPALVTTGEHVLDVTHGAVLDIATLTWDHMAMPPDVAAHSALLYGEPTWDGREVVLAGWGPSPGIAWEPAGDSFRLLPPPPKELRPHSQVADTIAVSPGPGEVVLIAGLTDDNALALDTSSGSWTRLPGIPGMSSSAGCPAEAAVLEMAIYVLACNYDEPERLPVLVLEEQSEQWEVAADGHPSVAAYPRPLWLAYEDGILMHVSNGTDDALAHLLVPR